MASSVSGHDKPILRSDWLPERARWRCPLWPTRCVPKGKFPRKPADILNALLAKLVRSRWLDIGLVRFCALLDLGSVSQKRELGQYPAILTLRLANPYMYIVLQATLNF